MSVQVVNRVPPSLRRSGVELPGRRELVGPAAVALAGFGAGALTAYGQGHLSTTFEPLVNSAGPWVVLAFGLALSARRWWGAAGLGALTLLTLLAGYVVCDAVRGFPSAGSTIDFWGLAAVLIGPVVGLAAYGVRFGAPGQAGPGAGLISGVLVGEAIYSLTSLDQPVGFRTPGYWWAELAVGAVLLVGLGLARFRSLRPFGEAVLICAVVTACLLGISLLNLVMYVG